MRSLLVCSHKDTADKLEHALAELGQHPILGRVSTIEACREALESLAPELVVLQHEPPALDALRLLEELGARPDLAVVVALADADQAVTVRCVECGAAVVVVPTPEPLADSLSAALARARSLTKLRQTEAALRASEASYRQLFLANPHPMWIYDLETLRFLSVNDAAVAKYGYSEAEFLGMTIGDIRPAQDVPAPLANVATVTAGLDEAGIWRHRKKDGGLLEVEITSHTLTFAGRQAEAVLANDVTARRRAERRVERLSRLYAALSQTNQAITRIREQDRLFQQVCRIAVEHGGLQMAWIGLEGEQGRHVTPVAAFGSGLSYLDRIEISADPSTPEGQGPTGRAIRTGIHQIAADLAADPTMAPWWGAAQDASFGSSGAFPLSDGNRVVGALNLYAREPLFFDAEMVGLLDEMAADISFALESLNTEAQRVRAEAERRRSETLVAVGTLVAGVAHEVRNPLFGLTATVDTLEARFRDHPALAPYLKSLRDQSSRLASLMSELLDYATPRPRALSSESIGTVVARALEACAAMAGSLRVKLESSIAEGLPSLRLDADRLASALQNVIENALQHSPKGGRVRLRAGRLEWAGEEWIEIVIDDSGPGFQPDDLRAVFEPFFSRRRGGTGLGLALAARIVEEHGGRIEAANQREGGGSVRITLPTGLPRAKEPSASEPPA